MTDDTPPAPRPDPGTITQLLDEARDGDGAALDRAWGILYQELRAVAQNLITGDGLQKQIDATELIGELWLRERNDTELPQDRQQFFGRAFRNMSRELIDRARSLNSLKRGGGWTKHPLALVDGALSSLDSLDSEQKASAALVMEAWSDLDAKLPEHGTVSFCRLVLGLSNGDTAKALGRSADEVQKQWYYARVKLRQALEADVPAE